MDFAFAPGATKYDGIMRKMLSFRASTTLITKTGVNSIKDFFNHLASAGVVATPLTSILLGTHGNESAWMNIQLDQAFDPHTTYEALEKAFATATRSCQLADAIINPRPVDTNNAPIPPFVFIRGCRIGVLTQFIQKFKDVINGLSTTDIGVAAPLFYHEIHDHAKGVFEGFNYDFHIFSKAAITTKAALVTQLDAIGHIDMYGTAITTAQWNTWVPSDITKTVEPLVRANLAATPITGLTTIKTGRYKFQTAPVLTLTMDPSVGTLPTDPAGIATFLKAQLNNLAANPNGNPLGLQLQSTHPLPFYTRYEYASIDDMVDNVEWTLNASSRVYAGKRYEYYVSPPVINNNTNNELVYNFYAKPSSGVTSKLNFVDNDANYFNVV